MLRLARALIAYARSDVLYDVWFFTACFLACLVLRLFFPGLYLVVKPFGEFLLLVYSLWAVLRAVLHEFRYA